MAKVLATVSGTALKPGISRNRRLYTPQAIASAVEKAQAQLAEGSMPLTMRSHHAAEDDSTRVVGAIRSITLAEDGSARFTADIADTEHGRTIASLLDTTGGTEPFLRGVSIRGMWDGKVRKERRPDGEVETSNSLTLHGLDYTANPGVPGAQVDAFSWARGGATETSESVLITESVEEARVTTITEDTTPEVVAEAAKKPYGDVPYADPGYLDADGNQTSKSGKPGVKRYPLSADKVRPAWSYINQAKNAAQYTPAQLKRVKGRIKAAMKRIGAKVTDEGWVIWPAEQVTETALGEHYAGEIAADGSTAGSFRICATNGPLCVELSSWCVDPADLELILAAAARSASDALQAMDPDMDGDIDVPGADGEDTDADAAGGDMPDDRDLDDDSAQLDNGDGVEDLVRRLMAAVRGESAEDPGELVAEARGTWTRNTAAAEAADITDSPAATPGAVNQGTEAPMEETTTQEAAPATAAPAYTQADVSAAVAAALAQAAADRKAAKAARKAKAAEAAPAAPAAVQESDEARIARIVEERLTAARAELAPAVTETEDERVARIVEARLVAERQAITAQGGGPSRKGLVAEHSALRPAAEGGSALPVDGDGNAIPMERWNEPQRRAVGAALDQYVMGSRALPAE